MVCEDHHEEINDPNDETKAWNNAENTTNPMTFFESGDETENPGSNWNDGKDQTNNPC